MHKFPSSSSGKIPLSFSSDFQKLLQTAAAKIGLGKSFESIEVCNFTKKILTELFPKIPNIQDKVAPISYKEKVLKLGAVNSGWCQEIAIRRHTILEKLTEKFGEKSITKIDIKTLLKEKKYEGEKS